ncbi:MAG: tetratricopeptide repeat protein, partial [Spirochaetales bacterium]
YDELFGKDKITDIGAPTDIKGIEYNNKYITHGRLMTDGEKVTLPLTSWVSVATDTNEAYRGLGISCEGPVGWNLKNYNNTFQIERGEDGRVSLVAHISDGQTRWSTREIKFSFGIEPFPMRKYKNDLHANYRIDCSFGPTAWSWPDKTIAGESMLFFDRLAKESPNHPLTPRASYLNGWSNYRLSDYAAAIESLARVRSYTTTPELQIEASFLLGRTFVAQNALQQAAATFRSLYLDHAASEYADDAWFEYAQVLGTLGNVDGAVSAFTQLLAEYPNSPLGEPASFRRAEVLFNAGRFADAQSAFFSYRTEFRDAERTDAALYWGGLASRELGEDAGALLLWDRLIAEYRESPFRPDAMVRAAAVNMNRAEYRQSLNLYTELQAAYEDAARAIGAQRRIDELVLLISGLTEREAELYVTIENTAGAESEDGRLAIIELSRLAIYEDTASGIDTGSVIPLLEAVAEKVDADPVAASQAQFLLGEYAYRQKEFLKAADLYLQAATVGAIDRDLTALSLYRAAVMSSTVGRVGEVDALVRQLEEDFPRSEWLEEARSLVREAN